MNSPKDYFTDRLKKFDKKFPIINGANTIGTGQMRDYIKAFLTETIEQSMNELIRKTEERLVGLCGTIHHEPFPDCEQCKGMEKLMKVIKSLSLKL